MVECRMNILESNIKRVAARGEGEGEVKSRGLCKAVRRAFVDLRVLRRI